MHTPRLNRRFAPRRVSFSSTVVYRPPDQRFEALAGKVASALESNEGGAAEQDFAAVRSAVLAQMPTAGTARYWLPIQVRRGMGRGARRSSREDELIYQILANGELSSFVSVSEDYTCISVTINIHMESVSVDGVIALGHSSNGRRCTQVIPLTIGSDEHEVHCLHEAHARIAHELGLDMPGSTANHFRCVEIREVGSRTRAMDVLNRYPCELYGMLYADEGWRHVGLDTARAALAEAWGTRRFIRAMASGDACLMVNLRSAEYSRSQHRYFTSFFESGPAYFQHEYRLAALEHGPFLAIELATYRKCIVDELDGRFGKDSSGESASDRGPRVLSGVRARSYRRSRHRSLAEGMRRLQMHPSTALSSLDTMVEKACGLPAREEYLGRLLRAYEAEEQINYTYRANGLIAALTWINVLIALIAAVATVAIRF
ncbi:hypothetical protein [Actinocorallia aurantiaca]|uniref:Uncharacterized protein n=1 Tax=Actinocorallia aurantiaca TaxID=46204 RepID=A0ABN3U744_9ACTN